jgi:glycosyltransferase involved in cell wall biosynthesis
LVEIECENKSLCVVNNIPTPYRRALFDEIFLQASAVGITFSVLYLAEKERVRHWKVEIRSFEKILPVLWQARNVFTPTSDLIINTKFAMRSLKPRHVILFGYNYPTYLTIALVRCLLRRPTYLFCETTLYDSVPVAWKRSLKSLFFRIAFHRFIVPGSRSLEYLNAHGVARERMLIARNASSMAPREPREPVLGEDLRLLFVGRLAPEKRIVEFVKVFAEVGPGYRLTIAGYGQKQREILEIAENHPGIEMLGSVEPDELSRIYNRHDVLVLVSRSEPWGLVVNEAINHGLALILSASVGSAPELLDGNGTYLEDFSVEMLTAALDEITKNLQVYRARSLQIAAQTTVERQAAGFLKVVIPVADQTEWM